MPQIAKTSADRTDDAQSPTPRGSAARLVDIRKVYSERSGREHTALHSMSLDVFENEFFTLLGPSGCGKTTLLRLIAGFEQPTAGTISIFGKDIAGAPPEKRPVNTVFQHYALFPHLSVRRNVGFSLEMLGRKRAEIDAVSERMLHLVGLEDLGDRRPTRHD